MHWNGELHSLHTVTTRELAEQLGWDLRDQVLSGEITA